MHRILTSSVRSGLPPLRRAFSQPAPSPQPAPQPPADPLAAPTAALYSRLRSDYSNVGEAIIKLADRKIYKQKGHPLHTLARMYTRGTN